MGKVKELLEDMEEFAWESLDLNSKSEARILFANKYPGQDGVFDAALEQWLMYSHDEDGC